MNMLLSFTVNIWQLNTVDGIELSAHLHHDAILFRRVNTQILKEDMLS